MDLPATVQTRLAYVDEKPVWYCPQLGTVLANEEILNTDEGPRSERGSFPVERRNLRQWVLRITAYADKLLAGLDKLDWPESTKKLQTNWIGRSEGAEVRFALRDFPGEELVVFTTRPDTLFGATYMVVAPEHPLRGENHHARATRGSQRVSDERLSSAKKSDMERTELAKSKDGRVHRGVCVINPVNGRLEEAIPIWVADYVLMTYGTGAIMAVPAHDERDYAFAKEFKLEIIPVIAPPERTKKRRSCRITEMGDDDKFRALRRAAFARRQTPHHRRPRAEKPGARHGELQTARLVVFAAALLG